MGRVLSPCMPTGRSSARMMRLGEFAVDIHYLKGQPLSTSPTHTVPNHPTHNLMMMHIHHKIVHLELKAKCLPNLPSAPLLKLPACLTTPPHAQLRLRTGAIEAQPWRSVPLSHPSTTRQPVSFRQVPHIPFVLPSASPYLKPPLHYYVPRLPCSRCPGAPCGSLGRSSSGFNVNTVLTYRYHGGSYSW